ncbi:hypothetical protein DFJ74DRAFT_143911 [Hyaloraphidium curvatum]|nr:hypothetical protein DFJ74DRAFT_143911 [Hyaloraphidium curvatum]
MVNTSSASYYPGVVGSSQRNEISSAGAPPASPPIYTPIAAPTVPTFADTEPGEGDKLPTYAEAVPAPARIVYAPPGTNLVYPGSGAQGVLIVNSPIATYVDEDGLTLIPSRHPVSGIMCPYCQRPTTTIVSTYPSSTAVMSSLLLCWLTPFLAFVPLCMPSCHEGIHSCSECRRTIGVISDL